MDREPYTIVGMAAADDADPVEGSVMVPCSLCDRGTWIGRALQPYIAGAARILCSRCIPRAIREDPEPPTPVVLPEVMDELIEQLRRDGTDA
ncbi:MAG TPA: hypothetical protein VH539_06960 [Gemmatimonadaceae bacterium]|jgi:hypothetical protein